MIGINIVTNLKKNLREPQLTQSVIFTEHYEVSFSKSVIVLWLLLAMSAWAGILVVIEKRREGGAKRFISLVPCNSHKKLLHELSARKCTTDF